MAPTAVLVVLFALLAGPACAQEAQTWTRTPKGSTITFTRTRTFFTPNPETTATPGTSLAAVYDITTSTGCTGKLYQTATYATVDVNNMDNTWANYDLSFYLDACPGTSKRNPGYAKGAIFATGLGTGVTAPSSYPKTVVGGFEGFSWVTSGYLQRISTTPVSTFTLTYK